MKPLAKHVLPQPRSLYVHKNIGHGVLDLLWFMGMDSTFLHACVPLEKDHVPHAAVFGDLCADLLHFLLRVREKRAAARQEPL